MTKAPSDANTTSNLLVIDEHDGRELARDLALGVLHGGLAFIYDAAEVEQGAPLLVAMREKEQTTLLVSKLPLWVAAMLAME